MTLILATLVFVFAIDRAAKTLALRRSKAGEPLRVAGLLTIRPVHFTRPATWPGGSVAWWVVALGLAFASSLLLVQIGPFSGAVTRIGLGAALGGALGNLYDRWRHGSVLDFLDLGRGGVFNPADAALASGLVLVLSSPVLAVVHSG